MHDGGGGGSARAPVERYPLRLVRQHEPRRDHQLCKIVRQYSHLLVPLKVDPRLLQQLYGLRRVHVVTLGGEGKRSAYVSNAHRNSCRTRGWLAGWIKNALDAEVEVELPRGHVLWVVPVLVRDGEADLDDLQQVDVTPHGLVVVVGGGLERPYWPSYNTWKFCVLSVLLI